MLVINPIMSTIFDYGSPIGYYIPINGYLRNWLNNFGLITFGIAGLGLCSLIIGVEYILKNNITIT